MSKEIGMMFKGAMVRAIRRDVDPKTETRRLMKPQPPRNEDFPGSLFALGRAVADGVKMYNMNDYDRLPKHPTDWDMEGSVGVARNAGFPMIYRPKWAAGDRIWTRETWRMKGAHADMDPMSEEMLECYEVSGNLGIRDCVAYRADDEQDTEKWRSAMLMPRHISRDTLEVLSVHPERLKDITEEGAKAEGIESVADNLVAYAPAYRNYHLPDDEDVDDWLDCPIESYRTLWESINGKGSWDANPFVWVLKFRRIPAL